VATQVIKVDARDVAFDTLGDSKGFPVFLLHGTPGSRSGPAPRTSVLYRLGIRLICYDRPGYGGSERFKGRTVADAAWDVLAIADHLNLGQFGVVGRSGGGPHALACAARLDHSRLRA
jgi:pimeloyl-ACP methyl ester carboxylesterase